MSLRKMRCVLDHSHSANSSQYFKSLPPRQLKPQVPEGLAKRPPTPRPESNFMLLTSKSYISNNGTNRCKPVRKFCIRAIFIAKIPGAPKKEILLKKRVSGEILGKPFGFFLLLSLGNENAERSLSALATRSAPVPVLACSHSVAPGHLLLPSRPEPSRKPPLEFVLIPWSKGWPGNPDANLQGRRGLRRASQPQAPFVSSRRSEHQKSTPDSILWTPLGSCALALSSHLGDVDASRCPRRGKGFILAGPGGADRLFSVRFQSVS